MLLGSQDEQEDEQAMQLLLLAKVKPTMQTEQLVAIEQLRQFVEQFWHCPPSKNLLGRHLVQLVVDTSHSTQVELQDWHWFYELRKAPERQEVQRFVL